MSNKFIFFIICIFLSIAYCGCRQVELYERLKNVPKAEWQSSYSPTFTFNINDTISLYDIYIVIRHTNSYAYNNVWLESSLQLPEDSNGITQKLDLQLANNSGWLGVGMDDIFTRRIKITAVPQQFKKGGIVTFTLKQIMRQNPLPGIMQIGVRIEKIK